MGMCSLFDKRQLYKLKNDRLKSAHNQQPLSALGSRNQFKRSRAQNPLSAHGVTSSMSTGAHKTVNFAVQGIQVIISDKSQNAFSGGRQKKMKVTTEA